MTWSYVLSNLALSTDAARKDKVRFLIQDVAPDGTHYAEDEEINFIIAEEANIYLAAAQLCDVIAGRSHNVQSKTVGDLSITYGAEHWKGLAASLRRRAFINASPTAGGISIDAKESEEEREDRVPPFFSRELHENDTGYDPTRESQFDGD